MTVHGKVMMSNCSESRGSNGDESLAEATGPSGGGGRALILQVQAPISTRVSPDSPAERDDISAP